MPRVETIGDCTLYHGDCRSIVDGLPGVDACITDPPYGIGLREHGRKGYDWTIQGDENQDAGRFILDWAEKSELPTVAFASAKNPFPGLWRQTLIWDKGPAVGGGGDIATCWKFCWDFIHVARTGRLNGKRDSDVLSFWVTQRDHHYHPNQKPLSLLKYLIEKTTQADDTILDPFMGSGSTGVACVQTGRKFVGVEIDETHFETACRRIRRAVQDQRSELPLEAAC